MIRLAWRQFRAEAGIGIGAFVVVAVVLAVTGPHLMSVYRTAPSQVTATDGPLQIALLSLLILTPALLGIFFGAPLIARELETGTYRLAWTQSVTRLRWLAVKLGLVGLASSLLAGGLSLMAAWWANPINIVSRNRFSPALFGIFGVVPFAYALFAFALGATVGLLFRKTVPAMATTLVGYVAARLAVTYWVRPHFEAPLTKTFALGSNAGGGFDMTPSGLRIIAPGFSIPNGWVLSTSVVDKSGHVPNSAFLSKACPGLGSGPVQRVGRIAGGPHTRPVQNGSFQQCFATIGAKFHGLASYQPASRYWLFQGYETALFVVLALVLACLSFWWVRRQLT